MQFTLLNIITNKSLDSYNTYNKSHVVYAKDKLYECSSITALKIDHFVQFEF